MWHLYIHFEKTTQQDVTLRDLRCNVASQAEEIVENVINECSTSRCVALRGKCGYICVFVAHAITISMITMITRSCLAHHRPR